MRKYTYYFKAVITAKNSRSAQLKADDHIKTKYKKTMRVTDFVDQEE